MSFSRRRFLEIAGLAGGALALRSFVLPELAAASPENPQLLLFCYFSGGWDQLLTLDPRPNNLAKFQAPAAYQMGGSGIFPAYDQVSDARVQALLMNDKTPMNSGVQTKGKLTFGPAIPPSLLAHGADLAVLRGVFMGTLTHEVGRRYFITGKFPRGLAAAGSALPTAVAAAEGKGALIPNLSVSTESYNETFPAFASGISVNGSDDLLNLLKPLGTALPGGSDTALQAFEASNDTCEQHALNGGGLVDLFKESRIKARSMVDGSASTLFAFKVPPAPAVADLFAALGITKSGDLLGPKGKAAIAAQALSQGVSQAVSVQLVNDLDDHFDWGQTHATTLLDGFDALGKLIAYLKQTPYKNTGTMTWEHTTLVVFSEFARTPLLNGRDGRDHHLANSCLVAGPGLKGNTVVGGTTDSGMAVRNVDLASGEPDDQGGDPLRPADIHATVLKSMGLDYEHLSNQSPQLVQAILK